jgi:hypothetical protein
MASIGKVSAKSDLLYWNPFENEYHDAWVRLSSKY